MPYPVPILMADNTNLSQHSLRLSQIFDSTGSRQLIKLGWSRDFQLGSILSIREHLMEVAGDIFLWSQLGRMREARITTMHPTESQVSPLTNRNRSPVIRSRVKLKDYIQAVTEIEQANPALKASETRALGGAQKVCLITVPRQSHQPPYLVK